MDFEGRTALVTGAGRGIGRAIALGLADGGAVVALVARSVGELDETAERIRERGGQAVTLPADLGSREAASAVAGAAVARLGRIDVLINNAATIGPLTESGSVDTAAWAAALQLNVLTPAVLSLALVPGMVERGWGRIANISSGVAARPGFMIGGNAYVTTKAALEAHTLNLAAEVEGSGVTVNAYRPGTVDTAMQDWIRERGKGRLRDDTHRHFLRVHAQGALISPADSAAALLRRLPGPDNGRIWDVTESSEPTDGS